MSSKKGVLLVNLGTPNSPHPRDVYRYLIEFLTDPRVIDYPWLKRQLLVRGFIVPARYKQSAISYKAIWTPEGSPLMVYGHRVTSGLQQLLGENYHVELSMRYQNPSIELGLTNLIHAGIEDITILPLFPQYASATTGSIHEKVMDSIKHLQTIPRLTFIQQFTDHPGLIDTFCAIAKDYPLETYDHFLFSFHGLPERQLKKQRSQQGNKACYENQCHATAHAIINQLKLHKENSSVSFQSRLGKEAWMQPYTIDILKELAKLGKKRVLVFCPSFVCDCLETTYEISIEYAQEFTHAGGHTLDLVRGLNDHPLWLHALKNIVLDHPKNPIIPASPICRSS